LSKKRSDIQTFFSTTVHAFMPQFRNCVILNIIMKSGINPKTTEIHPAGSTFDFNLNIFFRGC